MSDAINVVVVGSEIGEDRDNFKKWARSFWGSHDGFAPDSLGDWLDNIESSHRRIREALGGVRKTWCIKLPEYTREISDLPTFQTVWATIRDLMPCDNEGRATIEYRDLLQPMRGRVRTAKWVMRLAQKLGVDKPQLAALNNALSTLGDMWRDYTVAPAEYYATISTSPRAFMLLGHYGVDKGACFAQGGCHEADKYAIAQSSGTYVGLIRSASGAVLCRNWGAIRFKDELACVNNLYRGSNIREDEARRVWEGVFNELFGRGAELCNGTVSASHDDIYVNGRPQWVWGGGSYFKITIADEGILERKEQCPHCGEQFNPDDDGCASVGEEWVCADCVQESSYCESCESSHFDESYRVNHRGRARCVCEACRDNYYNECYGCHDYFDTLHDATNGGEGVEVCAGCIESDYCACDSCGEYFDVLDSDSHCPDCHEDEDEDEDEESAVVAETTTTQGV